MCVVSVCTGGSPVRIRSDKLGVGAKKVYD